MDGCGYGAWCGEIPLLCWKFASRLAVHPQEERVYYLEMGILVFGCPVN
jgi:hypothetical protein